MLKLIFHIYWTSVNENWHQTQASLTFEYWMLHFLFSRKKAIFFRYINSKSYFSKVFMYKCFFSTILSPCPWFLDYLQSITFAYIKDAIITMQIIVLVLCRNICLCMLDLTIQIQLPEESYNFQSFSPNHRRLVIFCFVKLHGNFSLVGDQTLVEGLKTLWAEFSKQL